MAGELYDGSVVASNPMRLGDSLVDYRVVLMMAFLGNVSGRDFGKMNSIRVAYATATLVHSTSS